MRRKSSLILLGATLGLVLGVVSELIRWQIGDDRSIPEMLWTLIFVPFGAFAVTLGNRYNSIDKDSAKNIRNDNKNTKR